MLPSDAVTVVLYNMMKSFIEMEHIPPSQVNDLFTYFKCDLCQFFTKSISAMTGDT